MRIQAFAMGFCLAWATVGVARADDVTITIMGAHKVTTFEFALDPSPNFWVSGREFNVLATVGGSTTSALLTFYAKGSGGGFTADDSFNFMDTLQLYSGTEENPLFVSRVYQGLVNSQNGKSDTVTVTDVASEPPTTVGDPPPGVGSDHPHPPIMGSDPPDPRPVATPELSTWAMLLLGFLGMGYASYRKARTRTIS
jgi:hypothetical protein